MEEVFADSRARWVPDTKACQQCKKDFTWFSRRHHCRKCGRCLCAGCCQYKIPLLEYGPEELVRICRKCLEGCPLSLYELGMSLSPTRVLEPCKKEDETQTSGSDSGDAKLYVPWGGKKLPLIVTIGHGERCQTHKELSGHVGSMPHLPGSSAAVHYDSRMEDVQRLQIEEETGVVGRWLCSGFSEEGEPSSLAPGFIITSSFFANWGEELQCCLLESTEEGSSSSAARGRVSLFCSSTPEESAAIYSSRCRDMVYSDVQKEALVEALRMLSDHVMSDERLKSLYGAGESSSDPVRFIVRVSSVHDRTAQYKPIVAVPPKDLHKAIVTALANSFLQENGKHFEQRYSAADVACQLAKGAAFEEHKRASKYKLNRAVVVMLCPRSVSRSGEVLSVDPESNSFDHARIRGGPGIFMRWAMGGSQLDIAVPSFDEYIIDKTNMKVEGRVSRHISHSLWPAPSPLADHFHPDKVRPCSLEARSFFPPADRDSYVRMEQEASTDGGGEGGDLLFLEEELVALGKLLAHAEACVQEVADIQWVLPEDCLGEGGPAAVQGERDSAQAVLLWIRPAETWVPLPPPLITTTQETQATVLLADLTSSVYATGAALSVAGTDFFQRLIEYLGLHADAEDILSPHGKRHPIQQFIEPPSPEMNRLHPTKRSMFASHGRVYLNISKQMSRIPRVNPRLYFQYVASNVWPCDVELCQSLMNTDPAQWRISSSASTEENQEQGEEMFSSLEQVTNRFARASSGALKMARGVLSPATLLEQCLVNVQLYLVRLFYHLEGSTFSKVQDVIDLVLSRTTLLIQQHLIPCVSAAQNAEEQLKRFFPKDVGTQSLAGSLLADLVNNPLSHSYTANAALSLFQLAKQVAKEPEYSRLVENEGDLLVAAIGGKEFSPSLSDDFMILWRRYMTRHGWRGIYELDVGCPRHWEAPNMLLRQTAKLARLIKTKRGDLDQHNPAKISEASYAAFTAAKKQLSQIIAERERVGTIGVLEEQTARWKLKEFHMYAEAFWLLGNLRHAHFYFIAQASHIVRQYMLRIADGFVAQKRLKHREDIFHLRVTEIDKGLSNAHFPLMVIISARLPSIDRLMRIESFPSLLDSRGARHSAHFTKGKVGDEYSCLSVSPGTTSGVVRKLPRTVDPYKYQEAAVQTSDILVAHTIGPGLSPLVLTSGAIVLEVGGLHHEGALVAREYNIPCAILPHALKILQEGWQITIDAKVHTATLTVQKTLVT